MVAHKSVEIFQQRCVISNYKSIEGPGKEAGTRHTQEDTICSLRMLPVLVHGVLNLHVIVDNWAGWLWHLFYGRWDRFLLFIIGRK